MQYLFGAVQEWRQQAEAAKGQLSEVGSTVRLLVSQQVGAGPTLENALPNYGKAMSAHDTVASKYPTETMDPHPQIFDPQTPRGIGDGQQRKPGFPLAPFNCNRCAFHLEQCRQDCDLCTLYLCSMLRKLRHLCAIFTRFMYLDLQLGLLDNRDFRANFEQFSKIFD